MSDRLLTIDREVARALSCAEPVVGLESTVIAHGLPFPKNIETARAVESIIRASGGQPATIAVLKGRLCVGLQIDQFEQIGHNGRVRKVSIRDLPIATLNNWDGATTVAAALWIARRAGIRVFATGGIGGVHRGPLPDISADLPALASTSIVVVCSGAKIVLDLPATREWLETYGITVAGYGCDEMPAFYSRSSGLPVDTRCDSPEEVAELFRAQETLGIERALLVTVPVPEEFEVPMADLQRTLDAALHQAETENVSGRELTPFLLSRMAQQSAGATLKANIALLENNARVATEIARALTRQ